MMVREFFIARHDCQNRVAMSNGPEPVGTVEVALAHADKLLRKDPVLAAEQAAEILKVVPGHPMATLIAGVAARMQGNAARALEMLEPLARAQPDWAVAHYELGLALGLAARGEAAVDALRRAVALKSDLADAWRALGDHLRAMGDEAGADGAYAASIRAATRDPRLLVAAAALCENRIGAAESMLREHLKKSPTDVAAIRMLAEVAGRLGRYSDAEALLLRCIELAPGFAPARQNYALVLHRQQKTTQALAVIDELLAADPRNPQLRTSKAAMLSRLGEFDQAIDLYTALLAEYPNQAKAWLSYGHALKTAGRQRESIDAYRRSIELAPTLGEAYWSLANLKTFRFSDADIPAMRSQLARSDLGDEDRWHFDFALGKALEDSAQYESSFEHYVRGNRLRRTAITYDPAEIVADVRKCRELFSQDFFERRRGCGHRAPDPIFVVGLPRAGSTLLEQILSSHSRVEGTMELPDVLDIARRLSARKRRSDQSQYPQVLASLGDDEVRELGDRYLQQTRVQRKTDAPFFIDKMPNNWLHTGLIHLILPNAKIVDARRHPLSCCFSNFKQHFARGQHFAYSLEEIGGYYRAYVDLMAHFDAVLPGRVHRVIYEQMVDSTEAEVRRLLDYCGLPFEASCLRFYETERPVRTASSEQVRSPIYRDAVDHWRNYERRLGPLVEALGPVLDAYPAAPKI